MTLSADEEYGFGVVANGRNWNTIRLLTSHAARWTDHQLTSIQFKVKPDDVLVIVKKDSPKGPQIAFISGANLDDALYCLAAAIKHTSLKWSPDKWARTVFDKKPRTR